MSSNKTANLQLNQWAAGDAFLREEFNQDNGKIDAAVGAAAAANCLVKIKEMTTTAEAHQVDLDISDILWDKYTEVRVYFTMSASRASSYLLHLNNCKASSDYLSGSSGTASHYLSSCQAASAELPNQACIKFLCMTGETVTYFSALNRATIYQCVGVGVGSAVKRLSQLTTLNFVMNETGINILPGAKFLVYGVLR